MIPHKLSPQYRKAVELVGRYNKNPQLFNKSQGESIAQIAYMYDLPFEAESKGMQKLLYNAGEGLTLGMLPNSWEPREIGEDYGFESMSGKIGGGVGNLLGLAGGVATGTGLLGAGARGLKAVGGLSGIARGGANLAGNVASKAGPAMDKAMHYADEGIGYVRGMGNKFKENIARARARYYGDKYYKGAQPMTSNLLPQNASPAGDIASMIGPQRYRMRVQGGYDPNVINRAMGANSTPLGGQMDLFGLVS